MKYIKSIIISCILLYNFQIQAQNVLKNNQKIDNKEEIHLESFSDFPEEIDGCSCYFSTSKDELKKRNYIFVNDFGNVAYIKIDGNLIRFELTNHDNDIYIYKYKDYSMKVEITKRKFIESELELEKGFITVYTPKGNIKQKFIGECGC